MPCDFTSIPIILIRVSELSTAILRVNLEAVPKPYGFSQALGKSGLKPAFSLKSKVAVPKLKFWNSLA
jgi:hypothetical protein